MKRRMLISAILFGLLLLPATAQAAGELVYAGKFFSGGNEFDIAQYTEDQDKVAVIGIESNSQRTSVAFAPDEWHFFVELWRKAQSLQSATWQPVGTFKETNTDELALLTVTAGPGVQLTITGKKGPFVFVLLPGDYAQFDATVSQTAEWAVR